MKKFVFTLLIFLPFFLYAQIIHIPDDYPSIQEGINAAVPGDTVLVAPGTYTENLVWEDKNLTFASNFLFSQDTTDISNTILDGGGAGVVLTIAGINDASCLCGFTIQNGSNPDGQGGGIWIHGASLRIMHMNIRNNTAVEGAGICCNEGGLLLFSTSISDNQAGQLGGGIRLFNSHLDMQSCRLEDNQAPDGGALFMRINTPDVVTFDNIITDCSFDGNTAEQSAGGAYIRVTEGLANVSVSMHSCSFTHNAAQNNAGLYLRGEGIEFGLYNSRFINNTAVNYNAGVSLMAGCSGEVINCLFTNNIADLGGNNWNGGGLTLWAGAEVSCLNCTFAENQASYGAGIVVGPASEAWVFNCVFWGNVPDQAVVVDFNDMGGILHLDYTAIQDGIDSIRVDPLSQLGWGDHNISGDPLFIGSGDDEYALSDGSPCIDYGTPDTSDLNLLFYDIINNFRIWDGDGNGSEIIDMGAYEFGAPLWVGIHTPKEKAKENFIVAVYPNPSEGNINIKYNIAEPAICKCFIYSLLGDNIMYQEKESISGENEFNIDLSDQHSGVYFIRLICGTVSSTTKMIIRK